MSHIQLKINSTSHQSFQNKSSGLNHSFDTGIAVLLGVNAAIVYNYICAAIDLAKMIDKNFVDGHYWLNQSIKEIASNIGYLSEKQVKLAVSRLEKNKYLIRKKLKSNMFNQTYWCRLND